MNRKCDESRRACIALQMYTDVYNSRALVARCPVAGSMDECMTSTGRFARDAIPGWLYLKSTEGGWRFLMSSLVIL